MTRPTHKQPVDVIIIDNMLHMVYCHTAIENLSDPIGYLHDFTNPYYTVLHTHFPPTHFPPGKMSIY